MIDEFRDAYNGELHGTCDALCDHALSSLDSAPVCDESESALRLLQWLQTFGKDSMPAFKSDLEKVARFALAAAPQPVERAPVGSMLSAIDAAHPDSGKGETPRVDSLVACDGDAPSDLEGQLDWQGDRYIAMLHMARQLERELATEHADRLAQQQAHYKLTCKLAEIESTLEKYKSTAAEPAGELPGPPCQWGDGNGRSVIDVADYDTLHAFTIRLLRAERDLAQANADLSSLTRDFGAAIDRAQAAESALVELRTQAEADRRDAERYRAALNTIGGGMTNEFPGAPDVMPATSAEAFRSDMWSWSQKVAKAALAQPQAQTGPTNDR